jgi:hypothetical protein
MPAYVRDARNAWSVDDLGDRRSRFTMEAYLELGPLDAVLEPVAGPYLRHLGRKTCEDLAVYAATGRVSSAKARAVRDAELGALPAWVRGNATFSAMSGAVVALMPVWWSQQFSNVGVDWMIAVGVGLLAYAVFLWSLVRRGLSPRWGRFVAGLDAVWIVAVATLLVAAGDRFSTAGVAATVLTSLVVAIVGIGQWRAATART